jgi:hypothetical protein
VILGGWLGYEIDGFIFGDNLFSIFYFGYNLFSIFYFGYNLFSIFYFGYNLFSMHFNGTSSFAGSMWFIPFFCYGVSYGPLEVGYRATRIFDSG